MKLRIRGNSVRLRVTRSELALVAASGTVTDTVRFGPGSQLEYRLIAIDGADVGAEFAAGALTVHVPVTVVAEWAATDLVSISGEQPLDGGEVLHILVEKDFECLAPRPDEPPGDFFANPAGTER